MESELRSNFPEMRTDGPIQGDIPRNDHTFISIKVPDTHSDAVAIAAGNPKSAKARVEAFMKDDAGIVQLHPDYDKKKESFFSKHPALSALLGGTLAISGVALVATSLAAVVGTAVAISLLAPPVAGIVLLMSLAVVGGTGLLLGGGFGVSYGGLTTAFAADAVIQKHHTVKVARKEGFSEAAIKAITKKEPEGETLKEMIKERQILSDPSLKLEDKKILFEKLVQARMDSQPVSATDINLETAQIKRFQSKKDKDLRELLGKYLPAEDVETTLRAVKNQTNYADKMDTLSKALEKSAFLEDPSAKKKKAAPLPGQRFVNLEQSLEEARKKAFKEKFSNIPYSALENVQLENLDAMAAAAA